MKSLHFNHRIFHFKSTFKNEWKAWAILTVGLILTLVVAFYFKRDDEEETKQEFTLVCNEIAVKIDVRLHTYAQLLRAGSALFAASDTVSRTDWKEFNEHIQIEKNLSGIQGVGFSLIVPKNKFQKHIQTIRRQGFPDYTIYPEGDRAVYTSIIYLEPFSGRNLRAFGYDMLSEPTRRKAMELSRDADIESLSGKVTLVQETKEDVQSGTLMYVPVYRNDMSVNTVEQRRAAIIGWVYSPYRMNDLMKGILGRWDLMQLERIHLQVYDDSISVSSLLYDSQSIDSLREKGSIFRSLSLPVEFNGKKWVLLFAQRDGHFLYFPSKVIVVFISGIIISLLLFLLSLSLYNTRYRAQLIAEQLTEDLKESESKLRAILDSSFDAIGVHVDGIWNMCNPAALRLFGVSTPEELIGKPILNVIDPIEHGKIRDYIRKRMEGIDAPTKFITRGLKTNGTVFDLEVSLTMFVHQDKQHVLVILHDITEKKKFEEAIAASALRYKTLLQTASDGIHILNTNGEVLEANNTFCSMLGYTKEELLQLNVSEWDAQWTGQELLNKIDEFIEHPAVFETKHRRKDGTFLDVEINAVGIVLDGQHYLYAAARDITERKRMELEREQFFKFFNIYSDLMTIADPNGCSKKINPVGLQMLGYSESELLEKPFIDFVHPDDRQNTLDEMANQIKTGSSLNFENRYTCKDGTSKVLSWRANYIAEEGITYATARDITEHKLAEEALRDLNIYNRNLIEASIDPLLTIDKNGKITDVNKATEEITGVVRESLIGSDFSDYFTEPEQARKGYLQVLAQGKVIDFPLTICNVNGKTTDVYYNATVYENANGEVMGVFAAARDITEHKRAEAELSQKNIQLQELVAEKDKFFSIIAHDLRGPFNGFLGLTQLMTEELPTLTMDKIQMIASTMSKSASSLYALLENLLNWARIKQGLIPFNPEITLIHAIVNECIVLMAQPAKNKEIDITQNIPTHIQVFADTDMLRTIIRNFVSNAVKYTPNGGKIIVSAKTVENNMVKISINDTGIGMNQKMIDNLFRIDVPTTRKGTEGESSTGLGLILCKEFIEKNGGEIWVESEVGKGSTFYFTLPA